MVNAGVILVMQRRTVPMFRMAKLVTTLARSPYRCTAQHMGMKSKLYMIVPQLTIRDTVDGPQPGKAAFILSLMGPQIVHSII